MKTNKKQKQEVVKDNSLIKDSNKKESSSLSIDNEIARLKDLSLNHSNESYRRIYKSHYKDLLWEKEWLLKESRAILKSALKGTKKEIEFGFPSLMKWNETKRFHQFQTTRPFDSEIIEHLGKDIKSISCLCRDGEERTFEIKKIEAFYGYGRSRNSRAKRCVNVYF
jgi:hypothetical protein